MYSRFRTSLTVFVALALGACDRETRDYQARALDSEDRAEAFGSNAYHLAQGQRLYAWMNCAGCHAHGGGGMGPPLRDDEWRYGGSMEEMVATILDGRPNGMPAFRDRITTAEAWQLATFVRAMSARPRHDILPARADEPSHVEPLPLDERREVRRVTPEQDEATGE
jgi:cytochrome c oxidase cbb3-type subunit III